ncbi:hypothetical protein [Microbacterium hatanonis]|uniref:LppP/LprE family lipoprotein n=1 Tax=Microbacterium hatanonis TaxID=404366 RepID=A0A5C8HVP4_9MICO|nr:hypothetical protein [Microbacterium hatanonis]TXK09342.1 hypothetical protein FVP77_10365 [Microbacterium hatanonis]
MTRTTSILAAAASLLLLAGGLAACATPSAPGSSSGTPAASPSDDASAPADADIDAAWLGGGTMIAVLTRGSSTCVPVASDVAYADGVLTVELADPPADQACTRDYVLRAFAVVVPEGVDPAEDLEIAVSGTEASGSTELAGVAGLVPSDGLEDGGVPTAGWSSADGVFALLTWGSSGCPPVVQDALVSAPGEITVTLAESPADRICTSDFAPRVTLGEVPGIESDTAYELVLQGDGLEGTRIPVAGVN